MDVRHVLSFLERMPLGRWFGLGGRGLKSPPAAGQSVAPDPAMARGQAAVPDIPAELPPPAGTEQPMEDEKRRQAPLEQDLVALPDPEADALIADIAAIKARIADFSARRMEMEQLVQRFECSQYQALGDRLVENLRLRHEYLSLKAARSGAPEDLEAAREAAAELDAYGKIRAEGGPEAPADLPEAERDELKRLYRAAVMRCHPDRVAAADQAAAHDLFIRAQAAYRQSDADGLRLLLKELGCEGDLPHRVPGGGEIDRLRACLSGLQDRAADILLAIQTLQLSEVYRKARHGEDWDDYFASVGELLAAESCGLKQKIRAMAAS